MTVVFLPVVEDPIGLAVAPYQTGRQIVRLDGHVIGDVTSDGAGRGGWLHCFGPDLPPQLCARAWPRWIGTPAAPRQLIQEALP